MTKFVRFFCTFWILFLPLLGLALEQAKTSLAASTITNPGPSLVRNPQSQESEFREIKAIVILAEFSDAEHTVSRETIKEQVFTEMRDYYMEASYGKISIVGDITQDWISLPTKFSSYGNLDTYAKAEKACTKLATDVIRAADSEVDFRKYDQVIIVLPTVDMVNYALSDPIVTNDGCSVSWVTVQQEKVGVMGLAHELGHSFGLPDLYDHRKAEDTDLDISPYVGPWCLMSYGRLACAPVHLCAFSKILVGWIPDEQVKVIPHNSTEFVKLEPLEVKTGGTQVIKISGHRQIYYLVEARRKIGFDKALPDEGVLVTRVVETLAVKGTKEEGNLLIRGPYGFVQVQDAEPETSSLNDATLDLRPGKKNVFTDSRNDLGIVVLDSDNDGYQICVTTPDKAEEMSNIIDIVSPAKYKASQTEFESPEAQALLKQADNAHTSVIDLLKTNNFEGATQKADSVSILIDSAISAQDSFAEATTVLTGAKDAISKAESEGRTYGLKEANKILLQAQSKLDAYDYNQVLVLAVKAETIASAATKPQNIFISYGWYIGITIVVSAAVGVGIWLVRKRKGKSSDKSTPA